MFHWINFLDNVLICDYLLNCDYSHMRFTMNFAPKHQESQSTHVDQVRFLDRRAVVIKSVDQRFQEFRLRNKFNFLNSVTRHEKS
jgi:hypothetical protein